MLILLMVELTVIPILYLLTKEKIEAIGYFEHKKEYPFHFCAPLSLSALRILGYKYSNKHDKKILKILTGLYGVKDAEIHFRYFFSGKLVTMYVALLVLTFFGVVSQTEDVTYIALLVLAPVSVFFLYDSELEKKLEKRHAQIRSEFPDMVSTLVLLVNAGMTVSRGWEKICMETKKDTPLYTELKNTYLQIQAGKSENEAYEDFARRCKVKEITKFITVVIQNMKKGNGDLVPLLKLQAEECWEQRKLRAKQLGEEASAKLILPLMIMFVGILVIVLLPAILQLRGFN